APLRSARLDRAPPGPERLRGGRAADGAIAGAAEPRAPSGARLEPCCGGRARGPGRHRSPAPERLWQDAWRMRRVAIAIALGWIAASARAQDADTVTVEVVSTPRGATVEVLGRGEVGRTPIRRLELPRGEHDFVFTRRGYARTVVHAAVTEDGQE